MALTPLHLSNRTVPASTYLDRRSAYDLNPPYQRPSVWTPHQQVALLRSLFTGLPIGAILVNYRGVATDTLYAVVDGKQRITTLRAFVDDEFTIPANWFDPDDVRELTLAPSPAFTGPGVLHSALSPKLARTLANFPLATVRASVSTVADEAQMYMLVNSAGSAHTTDDLARARALTGDSALIPRSTSGAARGPR